MKEHYSKYTNRDKQQNNRLTEQQRLLEERKTVRDARKEAFRKNR